jgi:hypothetical protein
MVEAGSHLNLLHVPILDMNKVFEYIEMVSIGIWSQPYTFIPILIGSEDVGVLGHIWSQNDVITPWLRLTASLKLLPPSIFEHIDMVSIGIWLQLYTFIPILVVSDFGVLGRMWSQNDVITSWLRLTATSNCFLHLY